MATGTHLRSTHIDAPVEKVFDYVRDPEHFFEAFVPERERAHTALVEVDITPEGVGSTARLMGRMFFLFHMEWTLTRKEYIPNERIVDHVPLGDLTITFEPDDGGTRLSMGWDWAVDVPVVGSLIDKASWNGDRDLDSALANLKKAIED